MDSLRMPGGLRTEPVLIFHCNQCGMFCSVRCVPLLKDTTKRSPTVSTVLPCPTLPVPWLSRVACREATASTKCHSSQSVCCL